MSQAKRNALVLLFVAGFVIVILAMSLPNLVLLPGQLFSLRQNQASSPGLSGSVPGGDIILWLVRGVVALAIIALPFVIGQSLITAQGRRRLLVYAALIVLLVFAANYLRDQSERRQPQAQPGNLLPNANPPGTLPPGAIFPATPPPEVTLAVVVLTWIVVVLLLVALIGFLRRRARSRRSPSPLQELAAEAQTAIDAIQAGDDLKATIVTCYREMSRVVREEKELTREIAMTPREFEDRLVAKGLPEQAVTTLTRLFERVRYGHIPAGGDEEKLALSCLADILIVCTRVESRHEA